MPKEAVLPHNGTQTGRGREENAELDGALRSNLVRCVLSAKLLPHDSSVGYAQH